MESEVIIAHQQRENNLRSSRLNSIDRGSKISLVEWDELGGNDLSALLFNKLRYPNGGDVTEVVVGCYRVKRPPKMFHRVRNECRADLLRWHFACAENKFVANTSFALRGVKVHGTIIKIDHRSNDFTRCAAPAAFEHGHF